jgi:hypothetical protein
MVFPLLLAVYPILHLYEANIQQVPLSDTFVPLAIVLGVFGILLLALRVILRDAVRAGFLVGALVIFVLYYGHLYEAAVRIAMGLGLVGYLSTFSTWHYFLLPFWGILLGGAAFAIVRKSSRLPGLVPYVNAVAALLVIMPVVSAGIQSYQASLSDTDESYSDIDGIHPVAPEPLPDIYYIILDGYGRNDMLLDYYGLDNSDFTDALTARGFYVATESRSNYPMTFLSLASSLNMEYLNDLNDEPVVPLSEGLHPFNMIRNNRVWYLLDTLGYTYVHISSGYTTTDYNASADINYRYGLLSEFVELCLKTTVLNPVANGLFAENARGRVLYSFDRLHEIPDMEEPTYTFAHLVVPHPPYVFDRNGNPLPPSGIEPPERDLQGYTEQLLYVNSQTIALVDDILARSDVPPIIILQADHGTASTQQDWMTQDVAWIEPPEELARERMAILNAYYLPGDGASWLYPSITPVNTFRLVFNTYFGTDLGLLEDRSYFSTYGHPYEFVQVSD